MMSPAHASSVGLSLALLAMLHVATQQRTAETAQTPAPDAQAEAAQAAPDVPAPVKGGAAGFALAAVPLPAPPPLPAAEPVAPPTTPPDETPAAAADLLPTPTQPPTTAAVAVTPPEPLATPPPAEQQAAPMLQEVVPPAEPNAITSPKQGARQESRAPSTAPPPVADATAASNTSLAPPSSLVEIGGRQGRALLRLIEHGAGPDIRLAWPDDRAGRERLAATLLRCYGMRPALFAPPDRLFMLDAAHRQAVTLARDRISGFMRQPGASLTQEEWEIVGRVRQVHAAPSTAQPVRLFSRAFDGALLAQLAAAIGPAMPQAQTITATWQHDGARLWLTHVRVDGAVVADELPLSPPSSCGVAPR